MKFVYNEDELTSDQLAHQRDVIRDYLFNKSIGKIYFSLSIEISD